MKKLEIEKTKPTIIISVLKVDIIKVGLVFSISNFFIAKTPLANNWRRKKIPSCSYLVYLVLKVLAWEICNIKLENAKKSHNTVTNHDYTLCVVRIFLNQTLLDRIENVRNSYQGFRKFVKIYFQTSYNRGLDGLFGR